MYDTTRISIPIRVKNSLVGTPSSFSCMIASGRETMATRNSPKAVGSIL